MHHQLKIVERYFYALLRGEKTAEIRYNDRDYQKGDTISFSDLIPDSGDILVCESWYDKYKWKITHILHFPEWLKDGYVVLSLKKIR